MNLYVKRLVTQAQIIDYRLHQRNVLEIKLVAFALVVSGSLKYTSTRDFPKFKWELK